MAVFFPGGRGLALKDSMSLGVSVSFGVSSSGAKSKASLSLKIGETPQEMLVNTAGLVDTSFRGIKTRQTIFFFGNVED